MTYVDETHAVGMRGPQGAGLLAEPGRDPGDVRPGGGRQGAGERRGLCRRPPPGDRLPPLHGARLHLHHRAAAGAPGGLGHRAHPGPGRGRRRPARGGPHQRGLPQAACCASGTSRSSTTSRTSSRCSCPAPHASRRWPGPCSRHTASTSSPSTLPRCPRAPSASASLPGRCAGSAEIAAFVAALDSALRLHPPVEGRAVLTEGIHS
ncbi:hypothetical protein [Nocardioides convexus]|uniref:hypothetical protein n=1 Tax=Nocardioides convexus TaxID=2712224 RepID=UPI002418980C|nr:hypothetical protein [Nocardioides convexus]